MPRQRIDAVLATRSYSVHVDLWRDGRSGCGSGTTSQLECPPFLVGLDAAPRLLGKLESYIEVGRLHMALVPQLASDHQIADPLYMVVIWDYRVLKMKGLTKRDLLGNCVDCKALNLSNMVRCAFSAVDNAVRTTEKARRCRPYQREWGIAPL